MRSRVPLYALLALLLLLGVAFAVYRLLTGKIEARVVLEGNLPELVVSVPRVDDGVQVEVLARTAAVQNGEARVVLAHDSLQVGRNDITVRVEGEETKLVVELDHWVFRDDEALSLDPPRLGIVVRALRGRTVSVDGQLIALSNQGEGRFSIAAAPDGTAADHTFVVRVLGGEEPVESRVRAQAEPAVFELRQPPVEFVTDRASLSLDLSVDLSATVDLDGSNLPLELGRARTSLALPREGDFSYRIDVIQPGRVRRRQALTLRRVANLAMASLSYEVDRTVRYEDLVAQADAHRGKRVELDGRVFNLRAEGGRTYLQLMAEPCATSTGCPVWIEYPAATLARIGDAVHARGVYVGMQTYRDAASGASHSSPHIEAAFLVVGVP